MGGELNRRDRADSEEKYASNSVPDEKAPLLPKPPKNEEELEHNQNLPLELLEGEKFKASILEFHRLHPELLTQNISARYNFPGIKAAKENYLTSIKQAERFNGPLKTLRAYYQPQANIDVLCRQDIENDWNPILKETGKRKYTPFQIENEPTRQIIEQEKLDAEINYDPERRVLNARRVYRNPLTYLKPLGALLLYFVDKIIPDYFRVSLTPSGASLFGSSILGTLRSVRQNVGTKLKTYKGTLLEAQETFDTDKSKHKKDQSRILPQLNQRSQNRYAQKLTDIYQLINPNRANILPPGWEKSDPKYGITTWTYDRTKGQDPSVPVGSDGKLIVKIFGPDSYDYVKTEDFIDRGSLIYKAAESLINEIPNRDSKEFLLAALKTSKANFTHEINKNCQIDPVIMQQTDKTHKKKHYTGIHKKAKNIIQHHLLDVAALIAPDKDKIELMVEQIKEREKKVVAEKGRPNIIKIGSIDGNTMVSAQFTQNVKTLPSTLRTGEGPIKLSNHVLDISGHINGIETENPQVSVDSLLDTHSTYSPYQEKDKLKRQKIAFEAVMEEITTSARNIHVANPDLGTAENPIPVSLSTLMLFTPLRKAFEKAFQEAPEINQMAVSRRALEMARHSKQPLEVEIDGQKRYVNFNLNYMSIPANEWGMKNSLPKSKLISNTTLEDTINAEGFFEYCSNIEHHLGEEEQGIGRFLSTEKRLALTHLDLKMKDQFQAMREKLDAYSQKNPAIKEEKKEMVKLEAEYRQIKNKINQLEKKQFSIYNKAIDKSRKAFDPKVKLNEADPNHQLRSRYLRIQELFYSGKYKQVEYSFQFHVLYLLTNQEIGRLVETFCKSAEDRTGWLRVETLAYLAFRLSYGHDPDLSRPEERETYDRIFSYAAHELSVSLDNTQYNSEARGFQVKGSVTNTYIGMSMGDQMAKLAKGVFEKLPVNEWKDKSQSSPSSFFNLSTPSNPLKKSKISAVEDSKPSEHAPLVPPRQQRSSSQSGLYSQGNSRPRSNSVSEQKQALDRPSQESQDLSLTHPPGPQEKIDFIKTITKSKYILQDFCARHDFVTLQESPQPMMISSKISLTSKTDPQFVIDVTKNCIKTAKLPKAANKKEESVNAMVELYMNALEGRKSKSHRIRSKNPELQEKVELKLAQALHQKGMDYAKINGKSLDSLLAKVEQNRQEMKYSDPNLGG